MSDSITKEYLTITGATGSPVVAGPTDTKEEFIAPDGRKITVVILSPKGNNLLTPTQNTGESDDAFIARALSDAKNVKANILRLPQKLYRLGKPIIINGFTDFVFDGDGATLQFTTITLPSDSELQSSFRVWNSTRVKLTNLKMEWDLSQNPDKRRTVYSQGEVVSCGVNCSQVKLNQVLGVELPIYAIYEIDPVKGWITDRPFPSIHGPVEKVGVDGLSTQSSRFNVFIGKKVLVQHYRTADAIFSRLSDDLTFENIEMADLPSSFLNIGLMRGLLVRNCKIGSRGVVSSGSDGIHVGNGTNDILVEKNDFSKLSDDSINIHGQYFVIKTRIAEDTITVQGLDWTYGDGIANGETALFYDVGLNLVKETTLVESDPGTKTMRFAEKIPSTAAYFICKEKIPRRIIVRDNYFHDHFARGILIQGANALVTRNKIERTTHGAILLTAGPDYWTEGPPPVNVIVDYNEITSVNHAYASDGLGFLGAINVIVEMRTTTMTAKPKRSLSIYGNKFLNVALPLCLDASVATIPCSPNQPPDWTSP